MAVSHSPLRAAFEGCQLSCYFQDKEGAGAPLKRGNPPPLLFRQAPNSRGLLDGDSPYRRTTKRRTRAAKTGGKAGLVTLTVTPAFI